MAVPITAVRPVFKNGIHYMTSPFGKRTYKNGDRTVTDHHNGIDLVAKNIAADHVTAFEGGTVRETLNSVVGSTPSQGNYVKIEHAAGVYTVYYHLKKGSVCVKSGDKVQAGQTIGYMGSSGNSTGPHLHFGISVGGVWQDPLPYLEGKRSLGAKREQKDGALSGTNIQRGEDCLVLYRERHSTKTNRWGAEVPVSDRGIVLTDPVYGVGNMDVPKGGKVLSGHGRAAKWILDNIKKGQLVWFCGGQTCIARGNHHSVAFNTVRGADKLVLYDEGKYALTNPYGFEVAVDKNGVACAVPVYGKGKMKIPEGGAVLSGHGEAGKWLYSWVKKGSVIKVDKKGGFVRV